MIPLSQTRRTIFGLSPFFTNTQTIFLMAFRISHKVYQADYLQNIYEVIPKAHTVCHTDGKTDFIGMYQAFLQ